MIVPSNLYKLYHLQVVLFKANPFSQISKCKTSCMMTSSRNMADLESFWAIMGDLNGKILQMTPFSLSTFHYLSDGTIKISFSKLLENLVYRDLYWKVTSSKNGIECPFFLVVLGPIRDLCSKFSHIVFFQGWNLILQDYLAPRVSKLKWPYTVRYKKYFPQHC